MGKFLSDIDRRRILTGGAASSVLGFTGLSAQTAPNPAALNSRVTVTANGATYSYPDGPQMPSYYVGFRSDGRIVFHLGALGDLVKATVRPEPYDLGIHHVKIEKDGVVLLDADIPSHWWNAEWTYRPRPIAIKKTPAQIVAANRMFPFGNTGAKAGETADYVFKGPMDNAGITIYMPATGERPDIGLITDASASYMLSGKPGPMLAWAQAAGSCPMHFRDEKTGKLIDLIKYPRANAYSQDKQGAPWLLRGTPDLRAPAFRSFGGGWTPQQAHYCEMSYMAHCATVDMGFLEDLQYSANFTIIADGYMSGNRGIATVFGELRGIAWAFRNLFMAHAATKDAEAAGTLPNTCNPSSYWKALLDNQLDYYTPFMNDPNNQTFRLVSGVGRFGPWQCDYMLMALAFGVLTGHDDWKPLYLWALKNAIDRTSGKSGFPPGWGTPYYLQPYPHKLDANGKVINDTQDAAKPQFSWYEAFVYSKDDPQAPGSGPTQAQIDSLKTDPLNGSKSMQGHEYNMTTRAVLFAAAHLEKKGLANVRAVYPEFDTCIANIDQMTRRAGSVNPRVSIVM